MNKKIKIHNQMINGMACFDKKDNIDVQINNISMNVTVKNYNVNIFSSLIGLKFICSCSGNIYDKFSSFYCKHIAIAIRELIKEYMKENDRFFQEKQKHDTLKENIDFLTSNIMNININESSFSE
jgi:hypothetical protein